MLTERHVVAAVQQVVAQVGVVAPNRYQDAAGTVRRIGEQAERHRERDRHPADLHVGGPGDDLVIGDHDHAAHLEVIVRVGAIAGGEHAAAAVHLTIRMPLAQAGAHPALVFLRAHVPDQPLLRLEVVPDAVRIDGMSALGEAGFARDGPRAVRGTKSLCFLVLEAERDAIGRKLDLLVVHRGRAEEVHGLLLQVVPDTVPRLIAHLALQCLPAHRRHPPHQHERDENLDGPDPAHGWPASSFAPWRPDAWRSCHCPALHTEKRAGNYASPSGHHGTHERA